MEINKCTSAVSAYNKITAYEGVKNNLRFHLL